MIVTRFKYCINGERGFTSVKHDEQMHPVYVKMLAEGKVKQKYKNKFGVFNLTDIKKVSNPKQESYGRNAENSQSSINNSVI